MKTRIVLASLLISITVVEVSAQRAEYDDMYFRGKDRERNKVLEAEAYASAKTTRQKQQDVVVAEEDNSNPTDSYSARNVNPEYVSRSNSEKASEDESNYYLEGYTPPASATNNFNNSYYNNVSPSANSYYGNTWNNPYYGSCACGSLSPYYGAGYYSPWMSSAYGYGGFSSGLSMSLMYGNYWSPYGGYGMYNPYYGYGYGYSNPYYGGYGYSPYYYGNSNYYYESQKQINYGKRPSRNSAVIQPTERIERTRTTTASQNVTSLNSTQNRQRQTQEEYYVRPSRRSSSFFGQPGQQNSLTNDGSSWTTPNSQQSRTRDSYSPSMHSSSPSYTPSYSPGSSSRGSSGSMGGGGGGSSPRPRGRN